ncbi:hypothetical protein OS493_035667 [Desmophyllum pertusum]|uniref:Uncharacterized protein n=1 Tax=Desmophyllum pertusum TaxID=174260 RepID=A0A9W9YW81_9CNID|nr:hypothetical protein OS493_035667 [Desmophyllum pertusum]
MLVIVSLLLANFCDRIGFEQSISVDSETVYHPAVHHVKNVTSDVYVYSDVCDVSTHLTWQIAFNHSFRPLFSALETIKTNGIKGQLCFRSTEQLWKMRITSFGQRFSQSSVLTVLNVVSTDDVSFRRFSKTIYCGNCRVYYIPSSRREKRRFRLRFSFSAEKKRSVELFEDSQSEGFGCLSEVECVITYDTPPLFYGILPLFELLIAAVITVILVSFQSFYQWFKVQKQEEQVKSLRTFLDDKILQLERIVNKDQPTKEECLTLRVELPGLYVFARELKDLANELTPGFGILPSVIYSARLNSIENVLNFHNSKHFPDPVPECACTCQKSNCLAHKEHERLLELSEEIEGFEYNFLFLACTRQSECKDIQALILKCDKFVEKLSSVTSGEICNYNAVRSIRKFLLMRVETLESKLSHLLKEKSPSIHTPSDCTADEDMASDVMNCYRYGGGNNVVLLGAKMGLTCIH